MHVFRLFSNQQSAAVFGIIRKGNKRMKIIVLLEGRLSVAGSLSEREIWSVLENRKILGSKRDWEKLHNEEFYSVKSSPNIVRVIKY